MPYTSILSVILIFLQRKRMYAYFHFPLIFCTKGSSPRMVFKVFVFFFPFHQWLLRIVKSQFIMIFPFYIFFGWYKVILVDGMRLWITFFAQRAEQEAYTFWWLNYNPSTAELSTKWELNTNLYIRENTLLICIKWRQTKNIFNI